MTLAAVALVASACGGNGHSSAYKLGYGDGQAGFPCHVTGQNDVVGNVIGLDELDDYLAGCAAGKQGG